MNVLHVSTQPAMHDIKKINFKIYFIQSRVQVQQITLATSKMHPFAFLCNSEVLFCLFIKTQPTSESVLGNIGLTFWEE